MKSDGEMDDDLAQEDLIKQYEDFLTLKAQEKMFDLTVEKPDEGQSTIIEQNLEPYDYFK